ncbi:proline-rich transmembrane protein 4-like [Montipora foliosa]|uniref:proline-rich transmembrane protein 4-like n=1 Tax=Montipora foliosa TaxID=591990 RepID=UPI0035F1255C
MTSKPEPPMPATEADSEHVIPEHESISWGQAEPTAEPQPEWSAAIHTWGAAWDFHQYGLGGCFGLIGLVALVTLLKLLKTNSGTRQKKVSLVVLAQIVLFGFSRCVFLCVDAYNSKQYFHPVMLNLIWGVAQPCLITAFILVFLVLRNAIVMKERFQNWYTSRNIALVTVPYFLFVFSSEAIVSFFPSYKGLVLACQLIATILYLSMAGFYVFISVLIWKKLRLVLRGTSETQVRGRQTFSILKRCIGAALGGFSIGTMHVYAMASVFSVFSDTKHVEAWPWFAFHTSMRCLEIGMSVLLYMTGKQNTTATSQRRVDVAPTTLIQSKPEGKVAWTSNQKVNERGQVGQKN